MDNQIITSIGIAILWCVKYLFIPFGIAVFARLLADRLSQPQPERHRKKRSRKDRLK